MPVGAWPFVGEKIEFSRHFDLHMLLQASRVLPLPLLLFATLAGSAPSAGTARLADPPTVVAAVNFDLKPGPRVLPVHAICINATASPVGISATVQDEFGVTQSEGFSPQQCPPGGATLFFLLSIPDGVKTLQRSALVFQQDPGSGSPARQRVVIPAQPDLPLPPPGNSDVEKMLSAMRGPDPSYQQAFQDAFDEADFAAAERLLNHLEQDAVVLSDGTSADEEFRPAVIGKLSQRDGPHWAEVIAHWQKTSPHSTAAALAYGMALREKAWLIRGHADNADLELEARKLFLQQLKSTERFLIGARKTAGTSPLYYELLISVVDDESKQMTSIQEQTAYAITAFPEHLELYVALADPQALHPHYVASGRQDVVDWVHADAIARLALFDPATPRKQAAYAVVYGSLFMRQPIEFEPFRDSLADWPDMKRSLDALIQLYPVPQNFNTYAIYACRARDWASYLPARARLDQYSLQARLWPSNHSPIVCDDAAKAASAH